MPDITIATLDGAASFGAYAAGPEGAPAIIVLQEVFGINPGIRQKCDRLADAGWRAIAPDLFWRLEPGVQLDPDVPEDFQKALSFLGDFSMDDAVKDIEASIRHARREGAEKVGTIGYCLGGGLAYMAATRTDADANVGYYGAAIPGQLNEAHAIARPLLLHFAGNDHFLPADKLAEVHAALDTNAHVTIHDYPGVDHGFATEVGARRVPEAAELADSRTAAFLDQHLR